MTRAQVISLSLLASIVVLAGCATRPVNPPITQADPNVGLPLRRRARQRSRTRRAWSSSPSPAAARALRPSPTASSIPSPHRGDRPDGSTFRLLDQVDVITGVSGGSFTALAYGLYGDKLFNDYEQRFLKRDVQGEIIVAHA